nr:MAG TPA: hypothetical protein [Caudoviricetes sp.]
MRSSSSTLSPIKTAGTPRLSKLTPQTPTYASSSKVSGGIIKTYQSRCFYFMHFLHNPFHPALLSSVPVSVFVLLWKTPATIRPVT